ncbi:hypothetical protein MKW94_004508 [Papaver nudicaule]|uniref:Thionin-like protein 2 n=1 Tax=Papaver nudicaule TaxID=74823 RepID=A0AA41S4A1_PAPNU|nr:hypothetical protein [Papaver nudicaule]
MKGAKLIIVMFLLLVGTSAGETRIQPNSFKKCYNACMMHCEGEHKVICTINIAPVCAVRCMFKLKQPSLSNDNQQPLHNYCTLGCASYNCINISTPENLRMSINLCGEEVERCLGSCSNKCEEKY